MEQKQLPVAAIVGPTGVGKTKISVTLAKMLGAEIISADSMQIYKHLDIATAKPSAAQMAGVPHHLLDILEPWEEYSAAQFVRDAGKKIEEISARGHLPLLVGGTGLYVDSLLLGVSFAGETGDRAYRGQLMERANKEGVLPLHTALQEIDPESAARIHPNNVKRVVRALEIFHTTGKTMTWHIKNSKLAPSPYRACVIGFFRDRQSLYDRIDMRVDEMLKNGLVKEIQMVYNRKEGVSRTAAQALGYKELVWYFRGLSTFDEAVAILKRDTRRYAKRQMTWFQKNPNTHWVDLGHKTEKQAAEECYTILKQYGGVFL